MLPHNEILEIGKILSDLFKQMIALDTAMIAATIAIVEKVFTTKRIFKSRLSKWLLGGSLSFFVFSLVLSMKALLEIANNLARMLQGIIADKWVGDYSFYGSIAFFLLGIIAFLALAIRSFTPSPTRESHAAQNEKETA